MAKFHATHRRAFSVCGSKFVVDPRYQLTQPLGRGAYGLVCAALDTETDTNVAIKKISRAFVNLEDTKRTLRELRLLRELDHDNIVQVYNVMKESNKDTFDDVYVVTELMDTDLQQVIDSTQPLDDEHVQFFMYQLLRGLRFVHSANVVHRDIKPSNLLVSRTCDLKICDLGLARILDADTHTSGVPNPKMTQYVATRWYRAPEIMLDMGHYAQAVDMWSVGCVLAELLGRKPLFPGKDYLDMLSRITRVLGSVSREDLTFVENQRAVDWMVGLTGRPRVPFASLYPHANPLAIDLLERLLVLDPAQRLTAAEALRHPYMAYYAEADDEPVRSPLHQFPFECTRLSEAALRELLWEEMEVYNPASPRSAFPSSFPFALDEHAAADAMDAWADVGEQQQHTPCCSGRMALAMSASSGSEGGSADGEADVSMDGKDAVCNLVTVDKVLFEPDPLADAMRHPRKPWQQPHV